MLEAMVKTKSILRLDPDFPKSLADIPRWPTELQVHGSLCSEGPAVAIVGARAASGTAMRAAYDLAAGLARRGYRIISGGALGIDAAAHRGALSVTGGYTLAVMACGLDSYYPKRNQRLFETIIATGGAVVSPFALGQKPLRGNFVRRNQVIAALADIVVLVEANTGSGSLHTARYALGCRRHLAVYSGSPGCESLLARGVPPVQSAEDVAQLLAGKPRTHSVERPAPGSPEAHILSQLSLTQPRAATGLAEATGISIRQVQRTMIQLELQSLALTVPGQRYLLSPLASKAPGDG